mmetsp:Transcript_12316/g.34265  ORF Transcript_12316/g.34265 Transcript_12316/m.34265 type:complete len:255 (-) Transcript_12316:90-854(-)
MNLHQPLVLLALVVLLAQVDQENDGLGGQEAVGVQVVDLLPGPGLLPDLLPGLQGLLDLVAHRDLLLLLLLHSPPRLLRHILQVGRDPREVLGQELPRNDLNVLHGVDAVLHVSHLRVVERPQHVEDPVHGGDVRKERVTEPSPLRCSFHETRDVHNLQERRHLALRLVRFDQPVVTLVRHVHPRRVRFDRAKREVFRWHLTLCHGVEQGALSHVWQTHYPYLQVRAKPSKHRLGLLLSLSLSFLRWHLLKKKY